MLKKVVKAYTQGSLDPDIQLILVGVGEVKACMTDDMAVLTNVRWLPCHHGTVCPQVVDGRDGLQIWG
jgi:hypothetical protein